MIYESSREGKVRSTRLTIAICLVLAVAASRGEEANVLPQAQTMEPTLEVLDEVLVIGTQPGPPLWQVKSGDNVLWVLAGLRLVAKDVTWRSKQVEEVLAKTKEVLVVHGSGDTPESARPTVELTPKEREALAEKTRRLPAGRTLRDVLPSDMHAHFEAVRASFPSSNSRRDNDQDIEALTPASAGNRLLNRAIAAIKLGINPVADKVVDMAKRRRVKVTVVEPLIWTRFLPVPTIESAMDICPLDELLHGLDGRGARLRAQANAWAVGDVERLTELVRPFPLQRPECEVRRESYSLEEYRIKEVWLTEMERALASNDSTLAVVDAHLFLSDGGLLQALRSRGYEVVNP